VAFNGFINPILKKGTMRNLIQKTQFVNSHSKKHYNLIEGKGFVFSLGGLVALSFPGVFEHILSLDIILWGGK